MRESELRVLHVTALGDRLALETLSHSMKVVDSLGVQQLLIALDEGRGAQPGWSAALAAQMRTLDCARLSKSGKLRALEMEFARLSERSLYAVHLHGMAACLLGSQALAGSQLQSRVVYSPHMAASPWTASLLGRFLYGRLNAAQCAAVTASLAEVQALSKLLNRSADVLPQPVAEAYFSETRAEAPRPSVVADGAGYEAVDVVSRLCVLLNGRDARVPISWLGAPQPRARAQLEASGVEVRDMQEDAERAQSLARASAFVHISSSHCLPIAVAQAMAVGVPCLVSDTPPHRALIGHGETGFVCTSERDLLEKLILLLRDPSERRRTGKAARLEAARRFKWRHFERALLRAYGFSGANLRGLATSAPPLAPRERSQESASAAWQTHFPTDSERKACKPFGS
jgi:hypothetical protein